MEIGWAKGYLQAGSYRAKGDLIFVLSQSLCAEAWVNSIFPSCVCALKYDNLFTSGLGICFVNAVYNKLQHATATDSNFFVDFSFPFFYF